MDAVAFRCRSRSRRGNRVTNGLAGRAGASGACGLQSGRSGDCAGPRLSHLFRGVGTGRRQGLAAAALEENAFRPDLESIPDEVWREASFILLSFPGNPVSVTVDLAYMERLVELARKWEVLVVHDLAYSEMGFDGYRPISILQIPGARDTAVEFHSFSKSFNMAGCRIGFLTGNAQAVGALRELKSNVDYGVFEPVQEAAVVALEQAIVSGPDHGVAKLYERRRNLLVEALKREGWTVPAPEATMFIWAKLPEAYGAKREAGRSRRFAHDLLLSAGVAVIPGDAFGSQGEGYVRIALVEEEEQLLEAARRIGEFLRSGTIS